jgi:putative ABC transport system permease protein
VRIRDLFVQALRRLRQRPVRSFLLLQGTVWGVAVAVFPSAVMQGTREAAQRNAAELGADRVALVADPTASLDVNLDTADVAFTREAVARLGVSVTAAVGVRVLEEWTDPTGKSPMLAPVPALLAGPPEAPSTRGHALAEGRWLLATDPPEACVVEAGVAAWLGLPALHPGDTARLPGRAETLSVVGVLAPRTPRALSTDDLGFDFAHPLYAKFAQGFLLVMGLPVVRDGWKRSDRCVWVAGSAGPVDWIFLRVAPGDVKPAAAAAVKALTQRGKTVVTLYPIVLSLFLSGQIERFQAVNLAMFLACLAMGAVVMANLGLLNVLTRGREIAIRRVEGATRRGIAAQFLVEGLLMTAVGSALGLGLGMLLAKLRVSLEPVTAMTWVFPWREAFWAVVVSLVVGLLAALLPAIRASRQDPVEGLIDD